MTEAAGLKKGIATIKRHARSLETAPGVYRMLSARGDVLYVGKAKNLRKRVLSYTQPNRLSTRLARMVAETKSMEFVTTHTEAEALLLEANLIKRLKPRFNVVLRDDKSFPYIHLSDHTHWPRVSKHRGARRTKGRYYGPFASAGAVNRTLNTMQRIFLLRSCSDSVLESRTRPCLLYQIKRCSAPCVGHIPEKEYDALVREARRFLEGKSTTIQKRLAKEMEEASEAMEYERAAAIRDRLRALTNVQAHQSVNVRAAGNADLFALHRQAGQSSIQVFFYRAGQNWGNRSYFPRHEKDERPDRILGSFIAQFYDNKPPPRTILVSHEPESRLVLEEAFATRTGHQVRIIRPQRGAKARLVREAVANAEGALKRRLAANTSQQKLLQRLADVFDLPQAPERVEVYDNSHVSGAHALGAMIVAGPEGFQKNAYRKFNIRNTALSPGDDYAMMREVLTRRFKRLMTSETGRNAPCPDLVLIDGGKGQMSAAVSVLEDLGLEDIPLVAISKGPDRNAGRETFHLPDGTSFTMKPADPALYFLQRLRDEAHRFAIGSHRARRSRAIRQSPLDAIPGVGPKRKKALLMHFGSAKSVEQAGVQDLEAVEGISSDTAQTIYDHFHPHQ